MEDAILYIPVILLIALSAFFSATETAFSSVNRIRLKNYAGEGNKRAAKTLKIAEDFDRALSAILIGNNIVNLTASSLATTFAIRINLTVGIATGILTVVILILGEIVPKNMAMVYSERLALFYAGIISGR